MRRASAAKLVAVRCSEELGLDVVFNGKKESDAC